jgi:Sec-independent protein translocase protein TatA
MLDFGFSELLLILVLAVVLIKPADMPRVLFEIGRWWRGLSLWLNRTRDRMAETLHELEVDHYRKTFGDQVRGKVEVADPAKAAVNPPVRHPVDDHQP